MKLYYLDVTMPLDVLSNTVHLESVSVASAEGMSLSRKGNRAVVPEHIHFNGVHGSKTTGMPVGSSDVQEERALTQPCQRLVSPCSLWSIGVGDQSL